MNRLELYTRMSDRAAGVVIQEYSTSFGMATRLLVAPVRRHVGNIYALVRVADEIVDGVADDAGMSADDAAVMLNELEAQTELAIDNGFSSNPIVHAFAVTAREVGFGVELTEPFFASMRADLSETVYDQAGFERYVYGSAEVIGLMCLAAFLHGHDCSAQQRETMVAGARALGAAFQKINFLRDLADDFESLGRSYFPGIDPGSFTEEQKLAVIDDIAADLAVSRECLPLIPEGSRRAVCLAQSLFCELTRRLRATPASSILTTRVSVPAPVKARLAAEAFAGRMPRL